MNSKDPPAADMAARNGRATLQAAAGCRPKRSAFAGDNFQLLHLEKTCGIQKMLGRNNTASDRRINAIRMPNRQINMK